MKTLNEFLQRVNWDGPTGWKKFSYFVWRVLITLSILFLLSEKVKADDVTQSNVNGGNTQIDGNMTTATTYESGSSSASTTTSTSTSNIKLSLIHI